MFDQPLILRLAGAMASHAADRHAVIARNIAHADTPGYRAQDLPAFATVLEAAAAAGPQPFAGTDATGWRPPSGRFLPVEPQADGGGEAAPNGNSVSLEREFVKAAEVRQQHELALAILRSGTGLLRSALGR